MRVILKKLERLQELSGDEYTTLMKYIQKLRADSIPSYQLFYQRYAQLLYQHYDTYLPAFDYNLEDVITLFAEHPELLSCIERPLQWQAFPVQYQNVVRACLEHPLERRWFFELVDHLANRPQLLAQLPAPRQNEVSFIYEDNNPYKEPGLKAHFDRLSRFEFITRLQSIRYLSRNKARQDRLEVLAPDRLGGIFTNKYKSIYYYVYLTEAVEGKAHEACTLLNLACYGLQGSFRRNYEA